VAAFAPSVDGTYYNTNYNNLELVYCYGSTNVGNPLIVGSKTIDTGAYGYWKLIYLTNSMVETVVTNITIKYVTKPRKRDYR